MKIMILGGSGMLGHKLWQVLSTRFETWITFRGHVHSYSRYGIFDPRRAINGVSVQDFGSLVRAFATVRPDVVVNGIGLIKQLAEARDPLLNITINSLFPHRLADLCSACGVRLIHVSTDCVFSGRKGNYTEMDIPDPEDLYGRSKLLGEVDRVNCLTLRTSIIGWELEKQAGLLEWFAGCQGKQVKGYQRAIYTGLSTKSLSKLIGDVIGNHSNLSGLYHVSSDQITKYDLLTRLRGVADLPIEVEPDDVFYCDRSLDSARFREETGWQPPTWDEMILELAREWPVYVNWRE